MLCVRPRTHQVVALKGRLDVLRFRTALKTYDLRLFGPMTEFSGVVFNMFLATCVPSFCCICWSFFPALCCNGNEWNSCAL